MFNPSKQRKTMEKQEIIKLKLVYAESEYANIVFDEEIKDKTMHPELDAPSIRCEDWFSSYWSSREVRLPETMR